MQKFNTAQKKLTDPIYEMSSKQIEQTYKKKFIKTAQDNNQSTPVAIWLKTFIQKLIFQKIEGIFSEDVLIEYAAIFNSELESGPIEHQYVFHLEGIFLEDSSIIINENAFIRKTEKSDLDITKDISLGFFGKTGIFIPLSILEIKMTTNNEYECREFETRLFNSLRLFRSGSVYALEIFSTKKTVLRAENLNFPGLNRGWQSPNYSVFKKYTVMRTETEEFLKFVNLMDVKLKFDKEQKRYRGLGISIERYNSALLESVDTDRKLMTAVMGLESLFTFERDRGENAYKLGIRVSKLLGNIGFEGGKIRKLIEEGYNFRNKVVHGTYISGDGKRKIGEIFPDILNYLRMSLVIFLVNSDIEAEKILEMIDEAMINGTANESLKKLLDKNRNDFPAVFKNS